MSKEVELYNVVKSQPFSIVLNDIPLYCATYNCLPYGFVKVGMQHYIKHDYEQKISFKDLKGEESLTRKGYFVLRDEVQ